ncbi:MAG: transcriptional repressor [Lachnospiraceae bacterium]|nr:transcriptional repressor [Lachnospiraceae bacterium]
MVALKYSRQRESIKELLQARKDHPTADMIYENVRQIYPNISLGTVYRNLSLLVSLGEIIKISTPEGADRFDARTSPHNHFICQKCHRVMDLEMGNIDYIMKEAGENFPGSIDSYTVHFFGLCEECKKNITRY